MNNTFNFNRFGKLLAMDGKKYLRNFGITLAILCCLNIGNWLLSAVFGFTMPTFIRWMAIYIAVFLSCILVPAKAFGDINLPRDGVRYAMLPVSNLEKYLSYVLYCIMTPVVVALVSWGIDSLLTLIPFGGFQSFIRYLGVMGSTIDFMDQIASSADMSASDLDSYNDMMGMFEKISSIEGWSYLVGILFNIGLFMMGNLLFKRHKTGATLGITIGISYVLSMLMQTVLLAGNMKSFLFLDPNNPSFAEISNMTGGLMTAQIVVHALLTIALYVGLFFKLKTQKY